MTETIDEKAAVELAEDVVSRYCNGGELNLAREILSLRAEVRRLETAIVGGYHDQERRAILARREGR